MLRRTCLSVPVLLGLALVAAPRPAQAGLFSVGPDKERRMGDEAAREIEGGARIVNGPVAEWVETVGQRLAAASNPEFKYSFRVIDSPEINAFALPGGYVYVFTGLRKIAQTDDELAAILAHEITHAEQHHYARQYARASKRGIGFTVLTVLAGLPNVAAQALDIVNFGLSQKYSRSHEFESDKMGMARMARAGFNPQAMVTLLDKLSKESDSAGTLDKWFGSHPDGPKRVEEAQQEAAEISKLQAQQNPQVKPIFAPWPSSEVIGTLPALAPTPAPAAARKK
jgi:predicted Zn-dependent protease